MPAVDGENQLKQRRLILIVVAYHPSFEEVQRLGRCLAALSQAIGYALVANDHRPGEAIDQLAEGADLFLPCAENLGYGRAVNRAVAVLQQAETASGITMPPYLGALNTDLQWQEGTMETALAWLDHHADVVLAVPQLLDSRGVVQRLCKRHPTVLGLLSRRFWPQRIKPGCLRRYDSWYVMADHNYQMTFDVPYLSGCCMLMRTAAFLDAGGFDERFFLYLEDADLTRTLASRGRCVHLPVVAVTHDWGRGNHRSRWLTLVNLQSAWVYFCKWGLRLV